MACGIIAVALGLGEDKQLTMMERLKLCIDGFSLRTQTIVYEKKLPETKKLEN